MQGSRRKIPPYISLSANAAAATGQIINIDGTGNRLSESLFGPETVYYVIGKNKIAPDLSSAMDRAKYRLSKERGAF